MDVRQLAYFLAIVDNGGFNRAARHLHLAQPSLSQAIGGLERHLGVLLFHRIGRRAVLTDAGRALIEPARQVLRDIDTAQATIASLKGLGSGVVDVVSMPSPSLEPLSTIIDRFSQRHPQVSVRVRAEPTPGPVMDAVRTGVAELGLLGAPHPVEAAGIRTHVLEAQRFVLILRPDPPITAKDHATAADLAGVSLIVGQQGTGQRQVVDEIVAQGVDVHIAVEAEHREAILPLVLKGVGAAVMTEAWAPLARTAGLRVLPLEPPSLLHICLVHRCARLTPAAEAFLDVAKTGSHPH
ncbi:MAG: LysR family transcriptional regulator [Propionibacteriales bacterium]|nr:LysR family transcriptional regulator [Propionibacteriales bacterium]